MSALLLAGFLFAALNVAYHVGARDFGFAFWLNLVVAAAAVLMGIASARSTE